MCLIGGARFVLARPRSFQPAVLQISRSVEVLTSPASLFHWTSEPEHLSSAMPENIELEKLSPNRWLWRFRLPVGFSHAFMTSLVDARPPYHLRWRTADRSLLPQEVSIDIFPAEDPSHSVMRVVWSLSPPFRLPMNMLAARIEQNANTFLGTTLDQFAANVKDQTTVSHPEH